MSKLTTYSIQLLRSKLLRLILSIVLMLNYVLIVNVSSSNASAWADMPECDLTQAVTQICFVSGTVSRGPTTYILGTDYELTYLDGTASNQGVRIAISDTGPNYAGGNVQEGDSASLTFLYPTSLAKGEEFQSATWLMAHHSDVSYTREVKSYSGSEVIEYSVAYEFLDVTLKSGCDYDSSTVYDFGALAANSTCEADDRNQNTFTNYSITFYSDGENELADPILDMGFLSTTGQSISWAFNYAELLFFMIGPRYKSDGTRNTGYLQTYFPENAIIYFFGETFDADSDLVVSKTVYESGEADEAVLTVSDGLSLANRDNGLVITVPTYTFSAPVFSFSNPNRSRSSGGSGSSGSGGGGSSSTTVTPVSIPTTTSTQTITRALKTRVRLSKIESLADFTVKPGQRLKIGIKKSSKGQCSISNGRVIATTSGDCVVRVTKFTKKGKKIKRFVMINYS